MEALQENELLNLNHSRFSDAEWYDKKSIIIGGVGGIGSWVSLFLSRIGHNIIVYDIDVVDRTNMAGQLYSYKSIGKNKTEAIASVVSDFNGDRDNVTILNVKYDKDSMSNSIVMSCFDNMEARKNMFNNWIEYIDSVDEDEKAKCIFIDGRMTAEQGQIYFVTPDKIDQYKETLFLDSEAEELPCSFKATTHNGAMIASQMVAGLNNFIVNYKSGFKFRTLPFSIKYGLEIFKYDLEL